MVQFWVCASILGLLDARKYRNVCFSLLLSVLIKYTHDPLLVSLSCKGVPLQKLALQLTIVILLLTYRTADGIKM